MNSSCLLFQFKCDNDSGILADEEFYCDEEKAHSKNGTSFLERPVINVGKKYI